jgi:uncharacterized protein YecE (DUF72 family)
MAGVSSGTETGLRAARVGCSGWNYRSWRGAIYPAGVPASSWLEHYATLFDTVEVNTTFYRLIASDAVKRWVEQTPEHFVFAFKASRYLTHVRRLRDMADGVARFYERVEPALEAGCLAVVLWQLPENFHRDDERLASALDQLPAGRHAFEFRHPSWFAAEVYALLREHGVSLVIGDHPARPFQSFEATTDWRYLRMHYGHRGRRGNYSARELQTWARRIHEWRSRGCVYVYFNNDWEAFAPANALTLRRLLDGLASGEAIS